MNRAVLAGCAIVVAAASFGLVGCSSGTTKTAPQPLPGRYVPAPPLSAAKRSLDAFNAANPNTSVAREVRGRFHVARDGVTRVYEEHVDFILPGYRISGHVTGFILRPGNKVTIFADFANGDVVTRHREPGSVAVSSLELGS